VPSADPIGISGGLNLYVYAGNDPVNHDDWRRLVELTRVSRSTLYRQLRDHGLSLRQFRHS